MEWEHHPSHFWLVLVTAAVNVALAYVTNVAAGRQRDARMVLISLAFLASAGFLGPARAGDPGRAPDRRERGLRHRDADRARHRVRSSRSLATGPFAGPRAQVVLRLRAVLLAALARG